MLRDHRTVALPSRQADGTFMYPVQVVVQSWGKWETGHAHFELVGWACSPEQRKKLEACLI